jgi:hypothetical protein
MEDAIKNFRLKIRNTQKLKRDSLTFSTKEGLELDKAIEGLEKEIERLNRELLKEQSLSIDIVGAEF